MSLSMKTFIPSASLKRIQSPEGSGGIGTYSIILIQETVSLPIRMLVAILRFVTRIWKSANLNSADAGSSLYQLCAYWRFRASNRLCFCRVEIDASHHAKGSTTDSGLLETSFLQPKQSPLCAWLRTDSITGNQPQGQPETLFAKSSVNAFVADSI